MVSKVTIRVDGARQIEAALGDKSPAGQHRDCPRQSCPRPL